MPAADLHVASWPGLVETSREYRHLFDIYVPIGLGVFGVILLVALFAVLRYRLRPPERAARWHEHQPLEGTYALLLAGTIAFLLWETFTSEHRIDTVANREPAAVTIDVIASRWEWTFYYPRYRLTVHSGTTGVGTFVVPAGEAVRFDLTSLDVIHAFWIPALDYKHDNFPASTQVTTLVFPHAGKYTGQCAEYCGVDHSEMVFDADAVTPARFAAWASSGGRTAP
jgi:cytochrome c oxidase subunit 2